MYYYFYFMKHQSISIFAAVLLFFAFTTMAFQCGKPKMECDEVMCTMEFREFKITTVDAQNNATIPDAVRITDMATNLPITTISQNNTNSFTIFSDGEMSSFSAINTPKSFLVEALVNNDVKGSTVLQFQKDCCHVSKVSGADSLVVN